MRRKFVEMSFQKRIQNKFADEKETKNTEKKKMSKPKSE